MYYPSNTNQQPRLLMLIHSLRRGGAERVCLELALGLMKRGMHVDVVSWVDVDEYPELRYQIIKRHALLSVSEYLWVRSIPTSAAKLLTIISSLKPNIIQIHTPNITWLAAYAGLKIPCVHVIHGYGDFTHEKTVKSTIYRLVACWSHRQLKAHLTVVSPSMRSTVKDYLLLPKNEKITTIVNGVDLQDFPYIQRIPARSQNILMVGTLNQNKGQKIGIEVFIKLQKNLTNARLLIAGDGPDMLLLKEMINYYGIEEYVQLLGRRENIYELLKESDVLWQLSQSEAMPMAVLESMACGIPVIGFDVRGVRDVVRNEETGFLVPYDDVQAVADRTQYLLNNIEVWVSLSKHARKVAESSFGSDAMVIQHFNLLYSLTIKKNKSNNA